MKAKKIATTILTIFLVINLVGCASLFSGKDISWEVKATADYSATGKQLAALKPDILAACPTLGEEKCAQGLKLFNSAIDIHELAGISLKAAIRSDNKADRTLYLQYMQSITEAIPAILNLIRDYLVKEAK